MVKIDGVLSIVEAAGATDLHLVSGSVRIIQQLMEEGARPVREAIRCANDPGRFCWLLAQEQAAGLGV